MKRALIFLCFIAVAAHAEPRNFRMGFSTWPYDITDEAVVWTYKKVQGLGDIVLEQLEEGVPWEEALTGKSFPPYYQALLDAKRRTISPKKKLVVAINPLNNARSGLALYRTDAILQPLPEPWASYRLDHPNVKQAYLRYAKRIVELMRPDYLVMGIEVNILMRDRPELWSQYVDLQRYVYRALKKSYPKLPLLVSVEAVSLFNDFSTANQSDQKRALKQILPYTDILGVSLHPFMSGYTTGPYPFDLFETISKFTKKRIAITETSFPAESFTLKIANIDVNFNGSDLKQRDFIASLLTAAQRYRYPFVIVFSVRDYDAIWEKFGKSDQLMVWRDTGLYSEGGSARSALSVWRKVLRRRFKGFSR